MNDCRSRIIDVMRKPQKCPVCGSWVVYKDMIRWFKTYVLSIRRDFVYLLIVDALFLLIMELVLREIPAPYPIFVRIGDLFEALGVAFFASFIFYFVQVHMYKIKEKEHLYPSIAMMFNAIISAETDILTRLLGLKMKEMSEETIKEKAQHINLYKEAPMTIGGRGGDHRANWLEYCMYRVGHIDRNVDMLLHLSAYLDSECMNILMCIQNFDMFLGQVRRLFPLCNDRNHTLTYQAPGPYIQLWHFIEEQEAYYDREFNSYFNRHLAIIA